MRDSATKVFCFISSEKKAFLVVATPGGSHPDEFTRSGSAPFYGYNDPDVHQYCP
jgi:hypothetical protein